MSMVLQCLTLQLTLMFYPSPKEKGLGVEFGIPESRQKSPEQAVAAGLDHLGNFQARAGSLPSLLL